MQTRASFNCPKKKSQQKIKTEKTYLPITVTSYLPRDHFSDKLTHSTSGQEVKKPKWSLTRQHHSQDYGSRSYYNFLTNPVAINWIARPSTQGNKLEIPRQSVVRTRGRHNYTGKESWQPSSRSGTSSRQWRPLCAKAKILLISASTREHHQVLTRSVTIHRDARSLKARFNCAVWIEQRHCTVSWKECDHVTRSGLRPNLYIIYMASGKSLRLSETVFLPPKGIMSPLLPISQDCHNNGMRPYTSEYRVNHNLQRDSICRVCFRTTFIWKYC